MFVGGLLSDVGAEPVDAGPWVTADLVEPAMMLLIALAYGSDVTSTLSLRIEDAERTD